MSPQLSHNDNTDHFQRSEGAQIVIFLAVSPGAPSRIFPLLQHILLPNIAWMLKPHPSDDEVETQMEPLQITRGGKQS